MMPPEPAGVVPPVPAFVPPEAVPPAPPDALAVEDGAPPDAEHAEASAVAMTVASTSESLWRTMRSMRARAFIRHKKATLILQSRQESQTVAVTPNVRGMPFTWMTVVE